MTSTEPEKKEESSPSFLGKVLVLGDMGVGKTSLVKAFAHGGSFDANYRSTIGVDFAMKTIAVDGASVRFAKRSCLPLFQL